MNTVVEKGSEQIIMNELQTNNGTVVEAEGLNDVKPEEAKVETKPEEKKEEKKSTRSRKNPEENKQPKTSKKEVEQENNVIAFHRTTRIEKSPVNRTIKNLFKNRKKLRFDLAIQRNEVWTHEQKSMLIHSILYGYPIPPVMAQETDDDFIWFLDGKQRLTTILGFLNGDFALHKNTPDVLGFKIAGHKFEDLTEDMRDIIYDESISIIKMKYMTDEERDEMFIRWNSGTGLSKIELTRAMHTELIKQINEISELPFFADDISVTDKARNRFVDQEIILQIAMLLDEGKNNIKGFGSTQIKDYVLRLKSVNKTLSEKIIKQFKDVSGYLNSAVHDFDYAQRTKALKKVHVPIIFYTAIKAMKEGVRFNDYGDFVKKFLVEDYSVESDYGQSCQKSSSKKESVLIRITEMNHALDEFIEELAKNKKSVNV